MLRAWGVDDGLRNVRVEIGKVIVVTGTVAGLLTSIQLGFKFGDDRILDQLTTLAVDRMSNVRVKFLRCVIVVAALGVQFRTTLVAVRSSQMILIVASLTVAAEFATGHRHEWTACAVDDFQISDDEGVINRDRTEGSKTILGTFHQLDSNLGDFQLPTLPNRRTNRTEQMRLVGKSVLFT